MILIIRKSDRMVINDRQSSHFKDSDRLKSLKTAFEDLPPNSAIETIDAMSATIVELESKNEVWEQRRLQNVCNSLGGVPADYEIYEVPEEDESNMFASKYIEEINGEMIYHNSHDSYDFGGMIIRVIAPQWVKGNYALMSDDVTDFSSVTQPLNFSLQFWQDNISKQISVELFTWTDEEDEDTATLPGKTKCHEICRGRIDNNQIVIGG